MSMFKKVLASVGIGSAKVDTRLEEAQVVAGGTLRGVVSIRGGQVEQQIDAIYIYVKTQYEKEENDKKVTREAEIARILITEGFLLQAEEVREIPFELTVPERTPVSYRHTPVWLMTGLDIKMALDPSDHDYLEVLPSDNMQVIFGALDKLGFRLREVTNEYAPRLGAGLPFVQEFEYVPTREFRGALDELEVMFFPQGDDLEMYIQIDRRARGLGGFLAEAIGTDESFIRFTLTGNELRRGVQEVSSQLHQFISHYS
ncbi:sporulation-control protein [Paenibacillus sophorae]|uniref:Sporulation protein n=1 Tax=Paenibacillus sophorae TaxID=1333845 RepID=A0A1H8LGP4_9BACL|nr:sporulation protein [Paenibacillus sophorae]QWU17292.1 sporulation protein [Paenibacillus sophorae]SEO04362.1 sporulation-control protein [Paenibacillus sophorae]